MSLDHILATDTGRRERKRVCRGLGSGLGKTGGRGSKGEGSRTGGKNRGPLFEGGQFPFWMRLPKRGFSNFATKVVYVPIPLDRLLRQVKGDVITNQALIEAGLVPNTGLGKIVSGGDIKLSRKLDVQVKVTATARAAIEAAGGKVA